MKQSTKIKAVLDDSCEHPVDSRRKKDMTAPFNTDGHVHLCSNLFVKNSKNGTIRSGATAHLVTLQNRLMHQRFHRLKARLF